MSPVANSDNEVFFGATPTGNFSHVVQTDRQGKPIPSENGKGFLTVCGRVVKIVPSLDYANCHRCS